jgi:D-cysteine desulfhydrase family pyridoxal phosphate-dependent enzyme
VQDTLTIDTVPRVRLAHLPTPLEAAPRLAEALGLSSFRVKRDDCTGLAMGGNKARKLEYLVADALSTGADALLTTGGPQSNHARMTAAAACRFGLRCLLFLSGPEPPESQGNLVLDRLFNAECRFFGATGYDEIEVAMSEAARRLESAGARPYIIPVGGSTPVGCLGYVQAVREIAAQGERQGWRPGVIVAAVGSTGTLAGLTIGRNLFLPECRITGVSVSRAAANATRVAAEIVAAAAARWELPASTSSVTVDDEWVGPAYGVATEEGNAAVLLAARAAGLILDPVYTGKALAGLQGLVRRGEIRPEENVVFWHTGGGPALFAYPEVVRG